MGQRIDPALEEMIGQLDEESVKELQLFVEFLLSKKGEAKILKKNEKTGFLTDMEEIPISLDRIIDRAEIYDNRG